MNLNDPVCEKQVQSAFFKFRSGPLAEMALTKATAQRVAILIKLP